MAIAFNIFFYIKIAIWYLPLVGITLSSFEIIAFMFFSPSVPEKKLVTATQCSQDCEERSRDIDQHIVLLIRGRHVFHRKMSQCGSDYDLLNNIDIPDRINQGNRMLAGQQDYPHLLLDSSAVDRFVDTESAFCDLSVNPEPRLSDRMDVAGSDNAFSQCPICSLRFPVSGLPDHVNSHFGS